MRKKNQKVSLRGDSLREANIKNQKLASPKKSSEKSPKRKPQTMEELLARTGYKFHGIKKQEVVEGEVVSVSPREILIDIGGKTEGTVARKELPLLKDSIPTLKIGEKVFTRILLPEGEKGRPILSLEESATQKKWQNLIAAAKKGQEIEVLVRQVTRGGVLVEYLALRGFIPQSQLDPEFAADLKKLMGKKILVKILEVDPSLNRLVLSQKAVTQKEEIAKLKKLLAKVKVGQVFEAEVTGTVPFGLFVKAGGLEGLVHISEIAWEKVENPGDFFQVGDKTKAKVLGIDESQGRLNLSIKQLTPDPWEKIEKKYKKEQIVAGIVARVSPYGAFVTLEKGIEGLIHVSKIPPGKEFKKGETLECVIEAIDKEARRISLSYLPKEKPVGYK